MTRMASFKALDPRAVLPRYSYPGDAGMDFAVVGDHTLNPGESRDLPSGIAVEFPPGYWGRITGRSSTLRRHGLFINEGVIDSGYRGELLTYVTNRQSTPVVIEHGTRLAQLILSEVIQTETRFVEELSPSERGTAGFGSTGIKGANNADSRSGGQPTAGQGVGDSEPGTREGQRERRTGETPGSDFGGIRRPAMSLLRGDGEGLPDVGPHGGERRGGTADHPNEGRGPVLSTAASGWFPAGVSGALLELQSSQAHTWDVSAPDPFDLYLGGPIDMVDPERAGDYHTWRHDARWWSGLNVFCPICMNKGETDYRAIIGRNTDALKRARFAVFDLRMVHHSIGTPVEIEQRIAFRSQIDGLDTFLVHPGDPGLFIRWWETRGAVRLDSFAEASHRIGAIAALLPALR